MKPILIFFIATTMPLVIFIATLLYGDVSNEQMKKALKESGVYEQMSTYLVRGDIELDVPFLNVVKDRFTDEYLYTKTETALDVSTAWISGKSQTRPVISFPELKEDLNERDPELLASLQKIPQKEDLDKAGIEPEQQESYLQQGKQIIEFTKNDFSIKIDKHLQGFKFAYDGLKIALPILVLLMFGSLFMVWKLADGLPAKFKWLGITFIVCAVTGFSVMLSHSMITYGITKVSMLNDAEVVKMLTPILLSILNHYMKLYASYQELVAAFSLIVAVLCFILMIVTRKQAAQSVKPLKVQRSYWEKTNKKK